MGLNLETLIGILVILILLILADGVRRMIRERHGRLRMRIDRAIAIRRRKKKVAVTTRS